MLYKHLVKGFTDTHKDKCNSLSLETATVHETKRICKTCANNLSKDKIPSQALSNNLTVTEPHPRLKKLCNLEKQLICKTIPFMKIFSLPKGSQHGLKGQVVSVPSNVQSTADSLPRDTQSAQIVAFNLKRRLSDKQTFCKEYISPQLVNESFHILKDSSKHYTDIHLNENWVIKSKEGDQHLWEKTSKENDMDDNDMTDNNMSNDEVFDA